jgi:cyclopropane-fatty-acyl-phospholipid synthase
MWTFYLAGCFVSFQYGGLVNYQLQFARSRTALPLTRDYMGEAEAALRGEAAPDAVAQALFGGTS